MNTLKEKGLAWLELVRPIRRERMRYLMRHRFDDKQADLAAKLGCQPDYISRCLSGDKNIGEEFARNIEDACGLPCYWMDGRNKNMTIEDAQFIAEFERSLTVHEVPDNIKAAIKTMVTSMPPKAA